MSKKYTIEGLKKEYEESTPITERGLIHYSEWLENKLVKNYSSTCMMCRKPKENDGHSCCEDCGGVAF